MLTRNMRFEPSARFVLREGVTVVAVERDGAGLSLAGAGRLANARVPTGGMTTNSRVEAHSV